jgi:tetratricopeptide (TPR) repeat protein
MNRLFIQALTVIALLCFLISPPCARAQDSDSSKQLERIAALINENRIDDAERQLNLILTTTPNNSLALNLLGTIRAKQQRLDDAEALFSRAVALDKEFLGAHMNLAYLYLIRGVPDKTISELREVLRLDPNNADVSYKLAHLLLSRDRIDECITLIEDQKRSQPVPVTLIVLLGDAYSKRGDPSRAEENYLQALNQQSTNAGALLGLAQLAQRKGDSKNAVLYLERAKDSIKDSPDLLYSFARMALNSGMVNEALAALNRATELKPSESRYYYLSGLAWLQKADLPESELAFRDFLKRQPDSSQGQMYLGYVLLKQKKIAEAREWLEKSAQKEAQTPEIYYYLGLIAQEQADYERAGELFEKAVRLAPTFAQAYIAMGATYLKLKDFPRAQTALETAVKLRPDDSKAHYNLALLFARLKDQQRAQDEMRLVEKLRRAEGATDNKNEILAPQTSGPK